MAKSRPMKRSTGERGKTAAELFDKLSGKSQSNMGQRTKEIAGQYGAKSRSAVSAADLANIRERLSEEDTLRRDAGQIRKRRR